jgi:hypothetical protein
LIDYFKFFKYFILNFVPSVTASLPLLVANFCQRFLKIAILLEDALGGESFEPEIP